MSEIERRTGRSNLKTTMKNQLFSMLKGVMDEDEDESNEQEFQIFDQEDTDEEDQAATEANTTLLTQCEFERDSHDKFQTTKGLKPNRIDNQNTFFNPMELSRKTMRKFQTISPNSINDLMGGEPFFDSTSLFSINQMNTVNGNNMLMNPYQMQSINNRPNWNPITSTNTFNFKSAYQKQTGGNKSCFYFNNPQQQPQPPMSQFKQMLNGDNILYQNLQPQPINGNMLFPKLESILNNAEEIDESLYMKYKGKFIYLIKNQQSSRIFQYLLDKTSQEIIHSIFEEIGSPSGDQFCHLLYDPYANYFLLKLFYFLNDKDRMIFLTQVRLIFVYCFRSLKTLITFASIKFQHTLFSALLST